MTNIEYLQSLGAEKALEFIDRFCPKQRDGCCKGCPCYIDDVEFCNAYTSGVDALGHWLFDEHKNESEKN